VVPPQRRRLLRLGRLHVLGRLSVYSDVKAGTRWTREQLRAKGFVPDRGGIVRLPESEWKERHGALEPAPAPKPSPIRIPRSRTPNATEQRWLDERGFQLWPDCYFRYEALSFRLESGAGYCPDWTGWRAGELVACVEVKGGWDHGSHSRSALAWKTAASEWPAVAWIWARWDGREWRETTIEPRRREP
jgi:hypothetical protein